MVPTNSGTNIDVYTFMNVTVTDDDADSMNVSFYWNNHTLIQTVNNIASSSVASINFTSNWLEHNTSYSWYVNITDGQETTHSSDFSFTTCKLWDTNGDGSCNYLDVSLVLTNYGATCTSGQYGWDIYADGECDYFDVSLLVTYYGE
jgi:hypothetical protein